MYVRWLELVGFRNYASLSFAPDSGLNALVGRNGQGKTSLLEAIHLLLTGRSFRTPRLAECVAWDASEAALAGETADGDRTREVRLAVLSRSPGAELRGALCPWARAVSFTAADLGLLSGGPPGRRAFLDGAAAKLVPAHGEACRRYRLVLHQRGRLLESLSGRPDAARLLTPWDEQLAALGGEILHRRIETLAALAQEARSIGADLLPGGAEISFRYEAVVPPADDVESTRARLLAALTNGRAAELRRGVTLVGPHRDDLVIRLGRADARADASRGEQRLLALTLRLAEARAVSHRLGTAPVFLLDDLLSELDLGARDRVLARLAGAGQVLFSTTDALPLAAWRGVTWDVREAEVRAADGIRVQGAA